MLTHIARALGGLPEKINLSRGATILAGPSGTFYLKLSTLWMNNNLKQKTIIWLRTNKSHGSTDWEGDSVYIRCFGGDLIGFGCFLLAEPAMLEIISNKAKDVSSISHMVPVLPSILEQALNYVAEYGMFDDAEMLGFASHPLIAKGNERRLFFEDAVKRRRPDVIINWIWEDKRRAVCTADGCMYILTPESEERFVLNFSSGSHKYKAEYLKNYKIERIVDRAKRF